MAITNNDKPAALLLIILVAIVDGSKNIFRFMRQQENTALKNLAKSMRHLSKPLKRHGVEW